MTNPEIATITTAKSRMIASSTNGEQKAHERDADEWLGLDVV